MEKDSSFKFEPVRSGSYSSYDSAGDYLLPTLGHNESSTRPYKSSWISEVSSWPIAIIVGQLLVLLLGFSFLVAGYIPREIMLPDRVASAVGENPKGTIIVSSLLATAIAAFSTYLFTHAIQYSLVAQLSGPMSLMYLSYGIELSRGVIQFRWNALRATAVVMICSLALGTQTAAWTTLITPTRILVTRKITGTELDVSTSRLQIDNNALAHDTDPYYLTADGHPGNRLRLKWLAEQLTITAGISAATARWVPNILNYRGVTYNGSTGGILDANAVPTTPLPSTPLVRVEKDYPNPVGFSTNYTMIQQGFSVQVECWSQDPTTSDKPIISMQNFTSGDVSTTGNRSWSLLSHEYLCPNRTEPVKSPEELITKPNASALFGAFCPTDDPGYYLLGFLNSDVIGKVSNITVCGVHPHFTTTRVSYADNVFHEHLAFPPLSEDAHYAADSLLTKVWNSIANAQSITSNAIADGATSVYLNNQKVNATDEENSMLLMQIYEDYVRGASEFAATSMRTAAWQYLVDDNLVSSFKQNMRHINGTLTAETMGWKHKPLPALLTLIPISFVTLVSIAITVFSIRTSLEAGSDPAALKFNPLDPAHLVVASAAGGLSETFADFGNAGMRKNEGLRLRFGTVDESTGKRKGLVHQDPPRRFPEPDL